MKRGHPVLSGFRVLGPLGPGPGPSSYLAVALKRSRPRWVVRELPAGSPLAGRLREDFSDLASLAHPSLALPTSVRNDGRGAYLLRPYVEGSEIASASQGKSLKEILPWLVSAAEALGILHRFGFLHRNLKTSNLLVSRTALFSRSARDPRVILCDPAWWPEGAEPARGGKARVSEIREEGRSSFASDLYALGAIFYYLITGQEMVRGESGFPPSPSELNPEVPLDLERSVMRLLHPEPSRRYQQAGALVEDLFRLRGESARPTGAAPEFFLDRKDELRRALASYEPPGRPAVVAVSGEAGMGKSAFLRRLELEAQILGFRTASARCFSETTAPLSPIRALAEELISSGPRSRSLRSRYRRLLKEASAGERRMFLRGLLDLFAALGASQPTLLLVDEAHLADSLSIEFLAALVRDVAAARKLAPGESRAPALALSFRTESPFQAALRPLLEALSSPGESHLVLELPPLPRDAVDQWLNVALPEPEGEGRDRIASGLKGHPFLIREALRLGGRGPGGTSGLTRDLHSLFRRYLSSLGGEERRLVKALAVLGRPATSDLLRAVLDCPEERLRPAIQDLIAEGTLSDEAGLLFFKHGSFRAWLLEALGKKEKQGLHRRMASILERREESVEEIAHHWLHSDSPREGFPFALKAARHLSRDHEDRRALVFYRAALAHLPPRERSRRRAIAEEAAQAHGRIGEHRRGMEILKRLLQGTKGRREAGRLHGRIGISCHRAGEVSQAAFHLEKGLSLLAGARGSWLEERLLVEAELAEIKNNQGDYAEAETICRRALEEIQRMSETGDQPRVHRLEMTLLENLAHLRLRRFEYRQARDLFERSLRAGEGLGAVPEKSLILNNLGILHIQENRFQEAIECYQRAEKLSARLGDDQSLAAIQSNLAVLYAKCGEPEAADEAMRLAAHHDSRCDSRRTRFLRLHSAGMVDLTFGRYASGIEAFQTAIALGEELKDSYTRAFDLIYLGECHLFRGEGRPAREAFERAQALGPSLPAPIDPMAEARKAVLAAQRGDARAARAALAVRRGGPEPEIPYLHSWNCIFLGWAHRLLGQWDEGEGRLVEALEFFSRVKVPAGEIHAHLELAALEADTGRSLKALKRLKALRQRATCGQGALRNPMLSARLLSYQTRLLLDARDPDLQEAASVLVEAESYLIGRRLQDLEALVRDLRRRLRLRSLEKRTAPALPSSPSGSAAEGLEDLEYLRGTASDLIHRYEEEIGERSVESLRRHLQDFEERLSEARRSREAKRNLVSLRADAIVGSSPAMRKVASLCLQVASSSLPVLITGETGTGKELVARVIHGESARRSAPFVSVSCAALPGELLEAELFGYTKGAFTGAEEDRPGLLRSAQGGTFLFDEVGEMPLSLQGKILRVLERGLVRPLGGVEEVAVDLRYLFTTSRNLQALMEEGGFRRDLFFRLRGLEVAIPPLRERLPDLPELVDHFRAQAGGDRAPEIGESGLRALACHPWPGNVRELANVVTRMVLTSRGKIGAEEARRYLDAAPTQGLFPAALLRSRSLDQLVCDLEREYLLQLHADRGGDLKAVASALGIKLRALYDRLKRLGIRPRELG